MSKLFNVDRFISVHVTERKESLFSKDLLTFHERLTEKTEGRSALVMEGRNYWLIFYKGTFKI